MKNKNNISVSSILQDKNIKKTNEFYHLLAEITHTEYCQDEYVNLQREVIDYCSENIKNNNKVQDTYPAYELFPVEKVLFPSVQNPMFTFIDLFAGIGGFRLGMQSIGGKCVFSSEWEENARKTYFHNYGEFPYGDITQESVKRKIPLNFDVLCGGFPCQAFSVAGYRKGFEDTRGTLFFDVVTIIKRHKPKVVFLENVKNLQHHDEGKTFQVIKDTLEELGYKVSYKVMNAMEYANIPQNRERIFIVAFDPIAVPNYRLFQFPDKEPLTETIHSCIEPDKKEEKFYYRQNQKYYPMLIDSIVSKDTVYQWRRQYVRENKNNVCPTLTANMGTGGHNVPLILTDFGIRKLTPKECLNFQGYPREFNFPDSIAISKMYMQAGNSVVVPLIKKICSQISEVL